MVRAKIARDCKNPDGAKGFGASKFAEKASKPERQGSHWHFRGFLPGALLQAKNLLNCSYERSPGLLAAGLPEIWFCKDNAGHW